MRRAAVAGILAAILLLTGCSSAGGGAHSESGGFPGSAPDVAVPDASGDSAGRDGVPVDREIVMTGQLDLVADDPADAADAAIDIVTGAGGRIDASARDPGNESRPASASVTARIPADEFSAVLDELAELGEVLNMATETTDVTFQATDLDARIASLTTSVDRLRDLIAAAETTADLIDIENALSSREAELESLTAQRQHLSDQVAYSTLYATFQTSRTAPAVGPGNFWEAVVAGFEALVVALGAIVIAFGAALPWLAFLALIGAVVLVIVRLRRRSRRRERPGGGD